MLHMSLGGMRATCVSRICRMISAPWLLPNQICSHYNNGHKQFARRTCSVSFAAVSFVWFRARSVTLAPSWMNNSAKASPIPEEPPVMRICLPSKLSELPIAIINRRLLKSGYFSFSWNLILHGELRKSITRKTTCSGPANGACQCTRHSVTNSSPRYLPLP